MFRLMTARCLSYPTTGNLGVLDADAETVQIREGPIMTPFNHLPRKFFFKTFNKFQASQIYKASLNSSKLFFYCFVFVWGEIIFRLNFGVQWGKILI